MYKEILICDVCNMSCRPKDIDDEYCKKNNFDPMEYITLKGSWGYFSGKDLETHECFICEPCYDKVRKFIKLIGGKVRVRHYCPGQGIFDDS